MTYAEKLKDPRWQKKRLQILEREKFTCQYCSDTETELHIHHLRYPKSGDPWDVNDSDLMVLCKHCHNIEESYKKNDAIVFKMHKMQIDGGYCFLVYFMTNDQRLVDVWHFNNANGTIAHKLTLTKYGISEILRFVGEISFMISLDDMKESPIQF